MHLRRYEILLPSRYNDGRDIMAACMSCFPDTRAEVLDRFGALSYTPQAILGTWTNEGVRYDDELFKLSIDVPDTEQSRAFIAHLKRDLLARFEQIEIYVTSQPIEVH
jgi:hypothetical protein